MKKYLSISVFVAGIIARLGCNNNEPSVDGSSDAQVHGNLSFIVGQDSPSSRTQYATNARVQID